MKAVICPVCSGSGLVAKPTNPSSSSSIPNVAICHGCGGTGWVIVPEGECGVA